MLLSVQIQALLYAFLMGMAYGITFSFKQYIADFQKTKKAAKIDIIYHLLFVCIMYYGLYKINGGISNIYLLFIFLTGIYLYYLFYYDLFLSFFHWIKEKVKPMYRKSYLLYTKYYSIIWNTRKKVKHAKKGKKKKSKFR